MKVRFFKFFLLGVLALAAVSFIVMLLWNWLIPTIFGLVAINFWQALGLFALGRILFGGFGKGHRGFGHGGNHFHKKWSKMTPEQQREFVEKRRKFGRHFFDHDTDGDTKKEG